MIDSLLRLVLTKQAEVSEMLVSAVMFFWGVWLLNPYWDTFSLAVFAGFPQFGSEELWGGLYAFVGLLGIICAATRKIRVRKAVILLQIAMWAFVATAFVTARPETTAVPVYVMMSVISFWLYIKLVFFELAHSEIMKKFNQRR